MLYPSVKGLRISFQPSSKPWLVERRNGLVDCVLARVGCDDFEVGTAKSLALPFAHLFDDLATDQTGELTDEAAIVAYG
jgi:hypothetical protein